MNLRRFVVSSSFAALMASLPFAQTFAADTNPASATPDAVAPANVTAPTNKKAVRAANRAFSRTVQKSLLKTKGLEDSEISVFGNAKTGHVTLAGQIQSEDQDGLAVEAAKKVQGVTSVSSKLSLHEQGGG